jgi:hypothetical protein
MRVYFPNVIFRVPVTVISDEDISPVELHMLQAVAEGVDHLKELRAVFGLGLRTTMEILNGMLRRNLLVIDFREGRFHVPLSVTDALRVDNGNGAVQLRQGGSHRAEAREVQLCLNRCSGGVSPTRPLQGLRNEDQILFEPIGGRHELADVDELDVMPVINALLAREGLRVRDLDLAEAFPVREGGLLAEATAVEWGDGDDEAAVTLQFDPRHNVGSRELLALEQAILETRRDKPWFWQRLGVRRLAAEDVRLPVAAALPSSLRDVIDLLGRRGSVGLDRLQVREVLDQAMAAIDSAEQVRVLLGASEVWNAAATLISGRHRQAILVCPFLASNTVERLRAALVRPQEKSAPVAVLHGIEPTLDEPATEAVEELRTLNVHVDPTGVSVHAKVAIQDARLVLIGTKNFLSSGPDARLFDVAVEIRGGPGTAEVLAWAKSLAGSASWAQAPDRLRWRPDELGTPSQPRAYHSLPTDVDVPADFTEIVAQVNRGLEGEDTAVSLRGLVLGVRAWFEEQQRSRRRGDRTAEEVPAEKMLAFMRDLADRLEQAGYAACMLVRTVMHRPMMFDALERARTSVMVCSHQLASRPLGPNFRRALAGALDRGLSVLLLWGEDTSRPSAGSPSLLPSQLQELAKGRPGRLLINTRPLDLHTKLMLVDETAAVITSFEFLHFLENPLYRRHELGIWIGSEAISRQLFEGVREHVRRVDPVFAGELDSLGLYSVNEHA